MQGTGAERTALVLTGGGARGAYQAGALLGMLELGIGADGRCPFPVLVGTSAGALNVGMLAAYADDWPEAVRRLTALWRGVRATDVFRTDVRSLGSLGAKWVKDLSFGGLTQQSAPKSLLDNSPLRGFLSHAVDFERLHHNIASGALDALVVSAVDLHTANGVAFVETRLATPLWRRRRWSVERARIGVDHLLASSAIPIFFPSVPINGRHFGDGSLRNTNPLSPAIHLDARRIATIGVRSAATPPELRAPPGDPGPTIAEISGVLLDAVMLDALEMDVAHTRRVNASVLACGSDREDFPFRHVDLLWLFPSQGVGTIAGELAHHIPRTVRYLLRGLGSDDATTELASYLLFDPEYCGRLVELGRADALARAEEVLGFFAGERDVGASP